jgi:hypothetical protein
MARFIQYYGEKHQTFFVALCGEGALLLLKMPFFRQTLFFGLT